VKSQKKCGQKAMRILAFLLAVIMMSTPSGFTTLAQTVSENQAASEGQTGNIYDSDDTTLANAGKKENVGAKETTADGNSEETPETDVHSKVVEATDSESVVEQESLDMAQASTPSNPVHHCTKLDDGTDYTDWSYVYFGSYPQSEVTDAATISSIESAIPSSGVSGDAGVDVWVNNTKYRRISSSDTTYSGYFGSNTYRYFKWERIKWRVLSNNGSTLFVVADKGLDCKKYNETYTNVTWETSTLRSWLGNQFYNEAFSAAEQSAIVTQTVVNDDNPYYGTEGGNNTNDKVYLLSIEEVTNPAYGFCEDYSTYSAGRWVQPSAYSRARGAYTYNSSYTGGNDNCYWWLRSPGIHSSYAARVPSDGCVNRYGTNVDYSSYGAVVPALHINLSSGIWSMSDDGTSGAGGVDVKIKNGEYAIQVADDKGQAIQSATINFAGTQKQTDSNGWAIFDKFTTGTVTLKVTSGALEYVDAAYTKKDSNKDIIILYSGEAGKYKLKKAVYQNVGTCDLLRQTKRLDMSTPNLTFDLITESFGQKSQIKKYLLMQGNKQIAESSDGTFKNLKVSRFGTGRDVSVWVYYTERDYTVTNLNLEFTKAKQDSIASSLKIGSDFSVQVSSNIPIVGGSKFTVDIPDLPITYEMEGDTVRFGFNVTKNTLSDENRRKEVQKLLSSAGQGGAASKADIKKMSQQIKQYCQQNKKFGLFGFGKGSIDFNSIGYAEAKVNADGSFASVKGYICVTATASKDFDWQYAIWVVPVTVNVKGELEVKASAAIEYVVATSSLTGNVKLNIKPSVTVFGGVGVAKVAAVGAYGKGALDVEISLAEYHGNPKGVNYVDLSGEFGLKAYIGPLKHEKAWKQGTWHVYTRTNSTESLSNASLANESTDGMYDLSAYVVNTPADLMGESAWLGSAGTENELIQQSDLSEADETSVTVSGNEIAETDSIEMIGADGNDVIEEVLPSAGTENLAHASLAGDGSIEVLQQNIYGGAKPQMVSSGTSQVMVYTDTNSARGIYNQNVLMYSYFDGTSFVTGKAVDDNQYMDINPYLYTDGDNIYVIYQEATHSFDNMDAIAELSDSLDIVIAKWNETSKKFDTPVKLTEDSSYDRLPVVAVIDNVLYAAWVANEDSEYFGQNQSNRICYSRYVGGAWETPVTVASELNTVTELAIGKLGDEVVISGCLDDDCDLTSADDRRVAVFAPDGSDSVIGSGAVSDVHFLSLPVGDVLCYRSESNLYYTASASQAANALFGQDVPNFSGEYVAVGDNLFYLGQTDNCSDIYMLTYDDGYGSPIQLTNTNQYIESLSIVNVNGKYLALFVQKDVTIKDETIEDPTTLGFMYLGKTYDLALEGCEYDVERAVPGEDSSVTLTVANKGSETVKEMQVTITNNDGNIVTQENISVNIASQQEKEVQTHFMMPELAELSDYTVVVKDVTSDMEQDMFPQDNKAIITLGYTDICVEAEEYQLQSGSYAMLNVTNDGAYAGNSKLVACLGDDSETYVIEKEIGELASGESYGELIPIEKEWFSNGCANIQFALINMENDYYDYNNSDSLCINQNVNVSFSSKGNTVESYRAAYGNMIAQPSEPVASAGEVFDGWYTDSSYGTKWDFNIDTVDHDMILYAKWSQASLDGDQTKNSDKNGGDQSLEGSDPSSHDNPDPAANSQIKVEKLSIVTPSKKLAAGKKVQLSVNVTPESATNKAVTWKVSNTKYASISKTGKLTLKKAGAGKSVTVTALAADTGKVKATCKVTIMKDAVKSIKLSGKKANGVTLAKNGKSATAKAGKSITLKATVKTSGKKANKALKWTSSNTKYATVSKSGKVKTKKAGKGKNVTITAASTDGSNKKAKFKIKIK